MADNFGLRKPLLSAYFGLRLKVLGADLGLPVVIGKEGWLFSTEELPTFKREAVITPVQAQAIRTRLDAWCEEARAQGAEFAVAIVPQKSSVYPDMMPARLRRQAEAASLVAQFNAIGFRCPFLRIDLGPPLLRQRAPPTYFRWGTHWNDRGAAYAWLALKEAIGTQVPGLQWPATDLSFGSRPASPLEDSLWEWFGWDDPFGQDVPILKNQNDAASGAERRSNGSTARLLVFGDSFLAGLESTGSVVAGRRSFWTLRPGERMRFEQSHLELDAWLIHASISDRDPSLMRIFKPRIVLMEVVERSLPLLAALPLPDPRGMGASSDRAFPLTDANWLNGVARTWAGFFVANSAAARMRFAPGSTAVFSDGQRRNIARLRQNGGYLEVLLAGKPLDGARVGFPNPIEVERPPQAEPRPNAAFPLTDANWLQGMAVHEAAFFVQWSEETQDRYRAGRRVRFVDGDVRTITRVERNGGFLNVHVSGGVLDGERLGYPHPIVVE